MLGQSGNLGPGIMLGAVMLVSGGCVVENLSERSSSGAATPSLLEPKSPTGSVRSSSGTGAGERTVEVMVSGETFAQARREAVRTAMQSTVAQLVISDRLIENSEVVRDDVFATQNGFVTSFEILEQSRSEFGEYELVARVSVSEDTIVNYVAYRQGSDSLVDGASLFAEVERGAMQRQVLDDMFRRFASGYPWQVVSLELDGISPVAGHDDKVVASMTAVSDPGYFEAMAGFLERVVAASYATAVLFDDSGAVRHQLLGPIRSDGASPFKVGWSGVEVPRGYTTTQVCIAPRPRIRQARFLGAMTSGIRDGNWVEGHCYLFPPGDYLSFFWNQAGFDPYSFRNIGLGHDVMMMVAFVDDSGRSALRPGASNRVGECMLIGGGRGYPEPGVYMAPGEPWRPQAGLPFRASHQGDYNDPSTLLLSDIDANFDLVLKTADIDMSRVTAFRGRPVFVYSVRGSQSGPATYLMPDIAGKPVSPEALCDELMEG